MAGPVRRLPLFDRFRQDLDADALHARPSRCSARHGLNGEPVKIGSPHFVDFGKNMEHSPDGKAYLVAHGRPSRPQTAASPTTVGSPATRSICSASRPASRTSTTPRSTSSSPAATRRRAAVWTSDFAKIKPIADWNNNMGCVTMTYDAPLKKYLMCVTDGTNTVGYFNTYILESDQITGPWKLVTYMKHFGEQAYFVNIPSKFISRDGRTLWLCYAANFARGWNSVHFRSRPPGSRYGMCLQEVTSFRRAIRFRRRPAAQPVGRRTTSRGRPVVTVSSTQPGLSAAGAVDGIVGGFPATSSRSGPARAKRTPP